MQNKYIFVFYQVRQEFLKTFIKYYYIWIDQYFYDIYCKIWNIVWYTNQIVFEIRSLVSFVTKHSEVYACMYVCVLSRVWSGEMAQGFEIMHCTVPCIGCATLGECLLAPAILLYIVGLPRLAWTLFFKGIVCSRGSKSHFGLLDRQL